MILLVVTDEQNACHVGARLETDMHTVTNTFNVCHVGFMKEKIAAQSCVVVDKGQHASHNFTCNILLSAII